MAINTRAKRASVLDLGLPTLTTLPAPDNSIQLGDRQHLLNLYSGILAYQTVIIPEAIAEYPFVVEPLALGAITTGNDRADTNPVVHLALHRYRGMTWKSNGHLNLWVRGDMGKASDIDFVALLGANASPTARMRFRIGNNQAEVDTGGGYDSDDTIVFENALGTKSSDGLFHAFHALPSPQPRRWWRIDITGHTGDFEAMALVIGRKQTPANFYNPDWVAGVEDLGSIDISPNGVPHETTGSIMRSLKVKFGWIRESEFELLWRPFDQRMGKRGMFLFMLDPKANSWRQNRTYFGWMNEAPGAQMLFFGKFEKEMEIRSII